MTFNLVLKRIADNGTETFGVFLHEDNPVCLTLERPWKNNDEGVSCIPTGVYECIKHNSDKFPDVWEITNVKDRTAILIHSLNFVDETHGCVGVGRQFAPHSVVLSKIALDDLRKELPDTFTLTIKEIT